MADPPPVRASIALAAYAEPLVEGRRAVVFGDATSHLAERLLERGARLIHVYDSDPGRVAEAAARNSSRNVTYANASEGEVAARDGAFDLAVVENLARVPSPAQLIKRLRRILAPRGVSLIASPNPEAKLQLLPEAADAAAELLDYYALYDLIAQQFEQVWMLGQTPFVGYAIAAFAPDGDPTPSFDTGFVPGGAEEPEWFLALASQRELDLEEFSVIQLPLDWTLQALRPRTPSYAERPGRRPPRTERKADGQPADPARELRRQLEEREQWIAQLDSRATAADSRADAVQAELEQAEQRLKASQKELRAAAQRASKLEAEAEKARRQLLEARAQLDALRQEHQAPSAELDPLRAKLAAQDRQLEQLRGELGDRESQLAALSGIEEQASQDVRSLEQQLRERAEQIQSLERELKEATRIGHELVLQLEEQQRGPDLAREELARKLDALAALNAQREGDLAAARYHVEQLQAELAEASSDGSEQLQQLRQRVEGAEALLQRQAVLLRQARSGAGPESPESP